MTVPDQSQYASVRYLAEDVPAAVEFYTKQLGFTLAFQPAPDFAMLTRGLLRILLSGAESSGWRATPAENAGPGRNRIHLVVDDLDAEVERLRAAGVNPCSDVVAGPSGKQILVADPAGNLVELYQYT